MRGLARASEFSLTLLETLMQKILIAIAVAGAFAAPVAAQMSPGADKTPQAQPVPPVPQKPAEPKSGAGATAPSTFDALDRNKDGYLSRDEAKDAAWSNRFSELDKDNDDRLSRSEFEAMTSSGAAGATVNAPDRTPSKPKQQAQ